MSEIVKVQRPISPPNADWLLYDREKKHTALVPADAIPMHVKAAMGRDFKGYFVGAWSSIVGWGLSDRVEQQEW